MPAAATAKLSEAIDFALVHGLLKRTPDGGLVHMPFALTPCPIARETAQRLEQLTAPFSRLVHSVARNLPFLQDTLGQVASTDKFTGDLLKLAKASPGAQTLQFQITRSDYFIQADQERGRPRIRQVELNTISSSYPGAAAKLYALHRHLLAGTPQQAALLPNNPLAGLADGFEQAIQIYGHADAFVLMVVQPEEGNVFDQRLLELALREREVPVRRMTLEEIAAQGELREGHLSVSGRIAAICYFRAGYTPDDFIPPEAFKGRELIENSSTISIPNAATQLAGTKKVQQVLADGAVLRRFCDDADATAMEDTFARIYDLDDEVATPRGLQIAWTAAIESPREFVLKPQREGGGNNLYEEELVEKLKHASAGERNAYILMERIRPMPHPATVVSEGEAKEGTCVSEIGRFGVYLADESEALLNLDAGYLVRTKGHEVREGGVTAGFAYLNSLVAEDQAEAPI